MNAPRWFYVVVACCAVAVSAAITYRVLRPVDEWVAYHPPEIEGNGPPWFLNTRTRELCVAVEGKCVNH